jgi:hypothetical protein
MRLLGAALIIYGAIGLAATLYGYSLVRQAFASAREVGVLAPAQQQRAVVGLQSISATLDDAAVSSSNLTRSFKEGQTSLRTAAQVARDTAASFREVAAVASVQIFGLQPLLQIAQPFMDSSTRLDDLAEDLTRTSGAVGDNASDMQRLSSDFSRLRTEVDSLRQAVAGLSGAPSADDGLQRLEIALNAMLVWIGMQGLASLFTGLAILLLPLLRRTEAR